MHGLIFNRLDTENMKDIREQIYEFIDLYVDTAQPKKLCSSIQDLVEELAESKVKNLPMHSVMRYFFISFNGDGVGAIWFNADGFPSHKQMLTAIKTKYPEMKNPVVTGIKELSEKDYNSLCA